MRLIDQGALPRQRALAAVTAAAADILGLEQGQLRVGAPADLALYDPAASWVADPAALRSAGKNSPYLGWEMPGRCRLSLVGGRVLEPG